MRLARRESAQNARKSKPIERALITLDESGVEGLRNFVTMPVQPADAPRGLGGDEHVAAQCDGRGGASLHGRLHLVPAHGVQPLPAFLRRCAFARSGPREMEPLLVLSVLVFRLQRATLCPHDLVVKAY